MKKLSLLMFLLFPSLALATANTQVQPLQALSSDSDVGSELSSLPASITRYLAGRHEKEATVDSIHETYGLSLCALPGFKCIRVTPRETWGELWPNEYKREIIMRLNRTNVALKYRHWLLVPKRMGRYPDYMHFSPLPEKIEATGHKILVVDLHLFAFGAYDPEGDLVYWGPATGGKKWCSDTHEDCESAVGKFNIYRMQGEDCKSSRYPLDMKGGAPMPYCMHYYKGFAIHGSTLSGFNNRSRGCIRVFYSDAKWLNKDFVTLGTEVLVRR